MAKSIHYLRPSTLSMYVASSIAAVSPHQGMTSAQVDERLEGLAQVACRANYHKFRTTFFDVK